MIPYIVTTRQLEIASDFWGVPWWELNVAEISYALSWYNYHTSWA